MLRPNLSANVCEGGCSSSSRLDFTYISNKPWKSAIQLELDVNGINDEEFFHVNDIDQYQPAKTPSVLCSHTHFKLANWHPQNLFSVIDGVLNRCKEISYEYIETDFKWNALYLECSHHCKFEIRIYADSDTAYTVDMNRLSGEGKCFNKLFLVFRQALGNRTSLSALDISVSAEIQSINICGMERDICPISEVEVAATLRPIKHMAFGNKYEAQCETSRMLCMLSKRTEIHPHISKSGIVTALVRELLNTRYCQWTRQHAMLALAALSESEPCRESMIAAGILPQLVSLAVDSPYDTAEMSRKAARALSNLTATPASAALVLKELSPMIVIMWMNSVSQFRDKTLKLHADRAVDHFMEIFSMNNIKCHLTSQALDSYKMNKGNRCYPGGMTNLMLAAQANPQMQRSPSSPSNKFLANIGTSSSTTQYSKDRSACSAFISPNLVSAPPGTYLSPTSVSSSASNFIYPPLTGRYHLMSDKVVDTESSVLAYSQDGSTALMYAAQAGNLSAVISLVNRGSNTEQQRKDGRTALHLAAANGHSLVVGYLLGIGSFFALDKEGMNAFLSAVDNNQLSVATILLDARPDLIHSRRHDGMTGLSLARVVGSPHDHMTALLLSRGAIEEIDDDSLQGNMSQNW